MLGLLLFGKTGRLLLIISFVTLFVIFRAAVFLDSHINGPRAEQMKEVLKAEFAQLLPPDGAARLQGDEDSKPRGARVGASYRTEDTYEQVRTYYDQLLSSRGWVLTRERPALDAKQIRSLMYCKGDLEAEVDYSEAPSVTGWNLGIDLVWGSIAHECDG